MNDIEDMFAELDRKMEENWRLRWYYRWANLKLDISEFYYKIKPLFFRKTRESKK